MKLSSESSGRLGWMDVLRGLLIISVVVGHATGQFNQYIYQFHMGAFFLISGYMSKPERRSVLHTIYHRFLTTYLPVFSATVLLVLASAVMQKTGVYTVLLGDSAYIGIRRTIEELINNNNLYVWWLGAAWFMLVLFGVTIINRLILWLCGNRYNGFYVIVSVLLYFIGYNLAQIGSTPRSRDLMLIAQLYFTMGTLLRHAELPRAEGNRIWTDLLGMLFFGFTTWFVADRFSFRVDYPERAFNGPVIDALLAVNGGLLCYFLARVLERNAITNRLLQAIGRNTLPIVLFHFLSFNLGYGFLYLIGVVPLSYLQNFTPTPEIGNSWWILFVITGIGGSIVLWKLLMLIPPLRFVFGQSKHVYDKIWNWAAKQVCRFRDWVCGLVGEKIRSGSSLIVGKVFEKNILILLCVTFLAGTLCTSQIKINQIETVGSTLATCIIENGIYEDGWCEPTASLIIKTGETGIIYLEGWYGQPLTGTEEIVVICNGMEAVRYPVTSDQIRFEIQAPANAEVYLVMQCSFSISATPPDIRQLSFIINRLDAT